MKCHCLPRSLLSAQIMALISVTLPIRCHGDRVMTRTPVRAATAKEPDVWLQYIPSRVCFLVS
jgi:hypothetical protein